MRITISCNRHVSGTHAMRAYRQFCEGQPITYHLSPITYHLSPITYHLSPITYYLFNNAFSSTSYISFTKWNFNPFK
jgi:hypothetical protein